MTRPKIGAGVVKGRNVKFGSDVIVWNYVVIGDNARIGDRTVVGSFCDIGKNVVIGDDCSIQAHATISNGCVIGNQVFVAPNSSFLNDKYPVCPVLTPPVVEDNAVIGGCATILPDVIVGEHAVVAAGSVVTKSVKPKMVVAGVPARVVMTLQEYEAKREMFVKQRSKH